MHSSLIGCDHAATHVFSFDMDCIIFHSFGWVFFHLHVFCIMYHMHVLQIEESGYHTGIQHPKALSHACRAYQLHYDFFYHIDLCKLADVCPSLPNGEWILTA